MKTGNASENEQKKKDLSPSSDNNEEKIALTPAELNELVQKHVREAMYKLPKSESQGFSVENMRDLLRAAKGDSTVDPYAYIDEVEIDPEDVIEGGYTFYCHQTGYVIVDDRRNGRPVQTPYGNKIFFEYDSTQKKGSGREAEIYNLSLYTTFSKKEKEWLKGHSKFSIYFFDSITSALSDEAKKAHRVARFLQSSSKMGQHELLNALKAADLPIQDSIEGMRISLAYHNAELAIEQEKERSKVTALKGNETLFGIEK